MNEQEASLIILNAKDLSMLAKIKLPYRIPFGVHSLWIPAAEIPSLFTQSSRHGVLS